MERNVRYIGSQESEIYLHIRGVKHATNEVVEINQRLRLRNSLSAREDKPSSQSVEQKREGEVVCVGSLEGANKRNVETGNYGVGAQRIRKEVTLLPNQISTHDKYLHVDFGLPYNPGLNNLTPTLNPNHIKPTHALTYKTLCRGQGLGVGLAQWDNCPSTNDFQAQ